jgi:hypothetical protein
MMKIYEHCCGEQCAGVVGLLKEKNCKQDMLMADTEYFASVARGRFVPVVEENVEFIKLKLWKAIS